MFRMSAFSRGFIAVMMYCAIALSAHAQSTNGLVTGTITDPTGAVVPGASVTVTDVGTGLTRTVTSDDNGHYIVPQLPPAVYTVVINKSGFASVERPNLQLQVNQNATVDFRLTLSSSGQRIEVTGEAPPLNTTSATLGDVVDHQATVDLPLNGRQFTMLTLLSPGAAPQQGPQQGSKTIALGAGAISPSVNGQRPMQNNFTMDGVLNNSIYTNIWAISPPPDALAEFNVQSHITDAQFAISSGANINIATRSGTDTFHGSLWEFIRNSDLDAQTYPSIVRLPYRQNQYGVYFGGPVRLPHFDERLRTWFSVYWEGFRSAKTSTKLGDTFTTPMTTGDFSALLGAQVGTDSLGRPEYKNEIYDPATSRTDPNNPGAVLRDPFPGNIIPTDRINPASALILAKYYPAPNMNVAATVLPNLTFTGVTAISSDVYGIRIDHRFGDKDTVFGRYNRDDANQTTPESLPGYLHDVINYAQQIAFGYTHLFGNSTILLLHYSNTKTNIANYDAAAGKAFVSSITNFSLAFPPKYNIYLGPSIGMSNGYSGVSQGVTLNGPQNNSDYHADLTKVIGSHTFGAGMMFYHIHSRDDGWNFSPSFTQNATSQGALAASTGMGPASFLLGLPHSFASWLGTSGADQTVNWYGVYVQDQWQATKRLTLTAGLRWDYVAPADFHRIVSGLNALTGQFCVTGAVLPAFPQATCPSGYFSPQYNGYEPRFGAAFRATDRTVLRGAFAILDDHNNTLVQENQDLRLSWPDGAAVNETTLDLGLPSVFLNNLPAASTFLNNPTPAASFGAYPGNKIPYSIEYNLGVEQQINNSLVMLLNYVGSVSRHQFVQLRANVAQTPGPGAVLPREPYPQYGGPFSFDLNEGSGNYNGLQAQLKKSLSSGLFFNASYTYSKSMDIQSSGQSASPENYYNMRQDYGPSDYDRRQLLVLSGVYVLPFGHGRVYLHQAPWILQSLVGNWNVGSIISLASGTPFYALAGGDVANTGGSNERAQRTGANPYLKAFTATTKGWLNPAAFALPAQYTFGNESRNDLVGPPYKNVDFNAYKDIPLKDTLTLQFRSEFFNVFNHTNYSTPSNTVTSSSFGKITGTNGSGREIQFALKIMF